MQKVQRGDRAHSPRYCPAKKKENDTRAQLERRYTAKCRTKAGEAGHNDLHVGVWENFDESSVPVERRYCPASKTSPSQSPALLARSHLLSHKFSSDEWEARTCPAWPKPATPGIAPGPRGMERRSPRDDFRVDLRVREGRMEVRSGILAEDAARAATETIWPHGSNALLEQMQAAANGRDERYSARGMYVSFVSPSVATAPSTGASSIGLHERLVARSRAGELPPSRDHSERVAICQHKYHFMPPTVPTKRQSQPRAALLWRLSPVATFAGTPTSAAPTARWFDAERRLEMLDLACPATAALGPRVPSLARRS